VGRTLLSAALDNAGCQPRQEVSAYLTGAVEVTFNLHYPPERTARPKPARNDL